MLCHLLVRNNIHYTGKPANIMYKSDVDWAPCLLLGHQKINLTVLEAAHERAKRYDARRKKLISVLRAFLVPPTIIHQIPTLRKLKLRLLPHLAPL